MDIQVEKLTDMMARMEKAILTGLRKQEKLVAVMERILTSLQLILIAKK